MILLHLASTSVQSKELGDFISKDAYVLIYEKYSNIDTYYSVPY